MKIIQNIIRANNRVKTLQNELEKKTDAHFTNYSVGILIVELLPFIMGVVFQYTCIKIWFINQVLKYIDPAVIKSKADIIISVETAYMGAAIAGTVFFFSVMDTGRIGIPYRKIMNYRYGTDSVFISIVLSVLFLFSSIIGYLTKSYYVWCGAGVTMVLLQSSVLWRVFRSTTYSINVDTIVKQEEKQLRILIDKRKELERFKDTYELYIDSFMGMIASSNAVTTDKAVALRSLLNVPFNMYASREIIPLECLFKVYFNCFKDIFVKVNQNEEQLDTVYNLFFELVSDEEKYNKEAVFWPMVTAVWYVASVYRPVRWEALCAECINHMSAEHQNNAFTVFILMCGFLGNYENAESSDLAANLCDSIICSTTWQYDENIEPLLTILWGSWMGQINGNDENMHKIFGVAPFLVMEEALSDMRQGIECNNCAVHAFMDWLRRRAN